MGMQSYVSGGDPSDSCSFLGPTFTDSTSGLKSKRWGCEHVVHLQPAQGTSLPTPAAHVPVPVFPITPIAPDLALTSVPLSHPPFHRHSAPCPPPTSRERDWPRKAAALCGARAEGGRGAPASPTSPPPGRPSARPSSLPPRRRSSLGPRGGARRHRPFPLCAPLTASGGGGLCSSLPGECGPRRPAPLPPGAGGSGAWQRFPGRGVPVPAARPRGKVVGRRGAPRGRIGAGAGPGGGRGSAASRARWQDGEF